MAALTGELTSGLFSALGDIIVKANELVVSITEDDSKMAALKETIGVLTAAVVAVTAAVLSYKPPWQRLRPSRRCKPLPPPRWLRPIKLPPQELPVCKWHRRH